MTISAEVDALVLRNLDRLSVLTRILGEAERVLGRCCAAWTAMPSRYGKSQRDGQSRPFRRIYVT